MTATQLKKPLFPNEGEHNFQVKIFIQDAYLEYIKEWFKNHDVEARNFQSKRYDDRLHKVTLEIQDFGAQLTNFCNRTQVHIMNEYLGWSAEDEDDEIGVLKNKMVLMDDTMMFVLLNIKGESNIWKYHVRQENLDRVSGMYEYFFPTNNSDY